MIANLALDGLEAKLREKYPKASNASRKAKANLVRFADDFIITGSSKALLEKEMKPLVEQFMKERGLELSQEKTHITPMTTGFDFLGQNIRKYQDGKVLVKPSKKNVKTFLAKIRKLIKENAQATAGNLIVQEKCWAHYITAEQLDEVVWQDVCAVLTHPELIATALQRVQGGLWLPQELQARRENLRHPHA